MAIFGTTGNDVKGGTDLADSIFGLAGDDELHGKGGNDLLSGDDGNDQMFGDEGNDLLFGGLDVGRDSDTLNGGEGVDTLTYGPTQHGMFVDLAKGRADAVDFQFRGPIDTLFSIENVIRSILSTPGWKSVITSRLPAPTPLSLVEANPNLSASAPPVSRSTPKPPKSPSAPLPRSDVSQ